MNKKQITDVTEKTLVQKLFIWAMATLVTWAMLLGIIGVNIALIKWISGMF